ncbi:hypothetical protein LC724_16390 [Blautia sp. RD014234]|nr:hypothetical protein [Blautia parvula]
MDTMLQVPIGENGHLKEFFEMCRQGGLSKEGQEIEQLLLVLENMEKQYEAVTRELQEVKGELSKVKNGSVKGKALSLIRQTESYVEEGKEQAVAIKGRILASIERAVEHAKDTGTLLIAQAIDLTRIPIALKRLQHPTGTVSGRDEAGRRTVTAHKEGIYLCQDPSEKYRKGCKT